jgi:hypothetical protein
MTEVGVKEGEKAPPAVFPRVIETPPGMPWDQSRIAQLEAARAAPMAISSLTLRLKRLGRWSHGAKGKFAALYVKTEDIGSDFTASIVVEGRKLNVDFRSKAQMQAQARRTAVLGVAVGSAVLLGVVVVLVAAAARHRADEKLDTLERLTRRQAQQAQTQNRLKRQNAALNGVADRGEPVAAVLEDLAQVSKSRLTATPLEGFHWRPEAIGVEVRGDGAPFAAGEAERLAKPLRPGVWLWARDRGPAPARRPGGAAP